MDPARPVFRLNDDQADLIRLCLKNAGAKVDRPMRDALENRVEHAIERFLAEPFESTYRKQHNKLRKLYFLAHGDSGDLVALRIEVNRLTPELLTRLVERADRVIPQLFRRWPELPRNEADHLLSGEPIDELSEPTTWQSGGDLRQWAERAPDEVLARVISALVADGAVIAPGKKRRNSKRSRSRIEPRIMGTARGAGNSANLGGQPSKWAKQVILISSLVFAWESATGQLPERGRSGATPFGDLVHQIFDWIGEPGAENALRRYWEAFDQESWVAD